MARPRTPTAKLELKGSFRKDPKRGEQRKNEPTPTGPIGDIPESFELTGGLKPDERKKRTELQLIWKELLDIAPARVLTRSDRWLVELACRTMQRIRSGEAKLGERNFLIACLGRMGLTPADRSRISVPKEKELDELGKLAAELRLQ